MKEKRTCPFCKEKMIYGSYTQVRSSSSLSFKLFQRLSSSPEFMRISQSPSVNPQSFKYEQFGWICSMKDDYCDIIFDEKDTDKNNQLYKEAEEKNR